MDVGKLSEEVKKIIVDHQLYRILIEKIGDGILLCQRKEKKILFMNQQALDMIVPDRKAIGNLLNLFSTGDVQSFEQGEVVKRKIGRNSLQIQATIFDEFMVLIVNDLTQVEARKKKSDKIEQLNRELQTIYEQYADDTIFITNGHGVVEFSGSSTAINCGVDTADLIGKNVYDLEREKVFFPSVSIRVLESKQSQVIIQKTKKGKALVAVGTPILDGEGNVVKVISITRDYSRQIKIGTLLSKLETGEQKEKHHAKGDIHVVTCNNKMLNVIALARLVAAVNSTVLITGETGTGKEVIANLIYRCSLRAEKPWIKVNCGAISPNLVESELFGYEAGSFTGAKKEGKVGLIEAANGGTLFLDEISELPMNQQVKLLQVLQEGTLTKVGGTKMVQLDVRIIAACNKKLEEEVAKGTFREDLFYRLNVVPIHIPPLRERIDDIALLVHHFMKVFNLRYGRESEISRDALDCLNGYDWPGNVRELENTMERLIITTQSPLIELEDIPEHMRKGAIRSLSNINIKEIVPLNEAMEEVERELIKMAIEKYGTGTKAAAVLGVNQSTISRKMKYYGIV